jgi:hypothetical protein
MATFPSLAPSAAPITPGAWPVSAITSLNGAESRIRQGSAQIGRRLQITFTNITEANFLAILAHYQGQRSGFDPFGFSTNTLAADLTPSGHAWLYASRPQVVDEHLDVFTVVCEFKSEPRGLVVAIGKAWRTGATTLVAGAGADGIRVNAGKQLATASTTLAVGARSNGAGSFGVLWATSATTLRPLIRILPGVQAPLLGSASATSSTGWTLLVNANADDANALFGSWPFTFNLAGTGYAACYVGSNGYATFGSGTTVFSSLSASNPALPKIFFGSGDLSWQRVYTQTGSNYARFRWEGHTTPAGATPGASTRIVEVTFWGSNGISQAIEIRTGNFASPSATQPFMLASASADYASATTLGANQSWAFEGNLAGTSWTLIADSYVAG